MYKLPILTARNWACMRCQQWMGAAFPVLFTLLIKSYLQCNTGITGGLMVTLENQWCCPWALVGVDVDPIPFFGAIFCLGSKILPANPPGYPAWTFMPWPLSYQLFFVPSGMIHCVYSLCNVCILCTVPLRGYLNELWALSLSLQYSVWNRH